MQAKVARVVFWCVLAVASMSVIAGWWVAARGPSGGEYNLDAFGKLAVTHNGRVKPMESVARDALDKFRGRQTAKTEKGEKDPVRWYLDAVTQTNDWKKDQVFRIDHPGVLDALGLKDDGDKYYSFGQLEPHVDMIRRQAQRASELDRASRSLYQKQLLDLAIHLRDYHALRTVRVPYLIPPAEPGGDWQHLREADQRIGQRMQTTRASAPTGGLVAAGSEAVQQWAHMSRAYHQGNAANFNNAVARYSSYLESLVPGQTTRAWLEVWTLDRFGPFYVSSILCIGVFLLGCLAWLAWMQPLRSAALAMTLVIVALVTFGIIARIYIQMRPPVTNLYSSAIFVAWGLLLLGIVLDLIFKNGVGIVAGAIGGFTTLVLAQNLAAGDTMEMMQAVLDTNFWLATHVTTVTMGYVATFAAGLLGIIFIGLGVIATLMNEEARVSLAGTGRTLTRMIYGVVCFALLLSFVGTVLGGLWADYSWGRFWGWDPKENGAAMIVLMNALILHARWGGMIKERGLAVLAVCGNIIVAWSWFGTNLLSVGLHSYGFMENGWLWMGLFVLSQMAIIAVGLMPLEIWEGSVLMKSPRRVQMERARAQSPPQGGGDQNTGPESSAPPPNLPPGTPRPAGPQG